jgi:hypothetical protein
MKTIHNSHEKKLIQVLKIIMSNFLRLMIELPNLKKNENSITKPFF